MYPLVRELAGDGIPVTVTCRVLGIARQPYYRWLAAPVTDGELEAAHLANAVFDAHRDDPEFGYRFLADEVRAAGFEVCDRTVWRHCAANGWWSSFGKPRSRRRSKAGAPAHDDLVRRNFTADAPNRLWLADITEHPTGDGKLYLCAIKDVFSNRIVGWSIDGRMKARLVVAAIEMAVARRGEVAGCILHSDRGQPIPWPEGAARADPPPDGRLDGPGRLGGRQRSDGIVLRLAAAQRLGPAPLGHPRRATHRDRHLDRTHLPPAPPPSRPRPPDTHRIRDDQDPNGCPGRLTQPVTRSRGSPSRLRILSERLTTSERTHHLGCGLASSHPADVAKQDADLPISRTLRICATRQNVSTDHPRQNVEHRAVEIVHRTAHLGRSARLLLAAPSGASRIWFG